MKNQYIFSFCNFDICGNHNQLATNNNNMSIKPVKELVLSCFNNLMFLLFQSLFLSSTFSHSQKFSYLDLYLVIKLLYMWYFGYKKIIQS